MSNSDESVTSKITSFFTGIFKSDPSTELNKATENLNKVKSECEKKYVMQNLRLKRYHHQLLLLLLLL